MSPRGYSLEFPAELEPIEGAKDLHDWFGYWPNFHDANLIRLDLDRSDAATMLLHTWEMTKETDAKGYFVLVKHVIVEFVLKGIVALSLDGFAHENTLMGLAIERVNRGYLLTLDDVYGITGTIEAASISMRLIPGKPKDIS
jgi:Immunity protein 50